MSGGIPVWKGKTWANLLPLFSLQTMRRADGGDGIRLAVSVPSHLCIVFTYLCYFFPGLPETGLRVPRGNIPRTGLLFATARYFVNIEKAKLFSGSPPYPLETCQTAGFQTTNAKVSQRA